MLFIEIFSILVMFSSYASSIEKISKIFDYSKNEYDLNLTMEIFKEFETKYGKKYKNDDEQTKFYATFKENLIKINMLNQLTNSSIFKVNEFTYLNLDEFTANYTGYKDDESTRNNVTKYDYKPLANESESKDYRKDGLLMVKQQMGCRNSYVFSAVGNIEAQYSKKFKLVTVLSEQHAFDCEPLGNCKDGGVPHHVFATLMQQGGAMQLVDYPIQNEKGACRTNIEKITVRFKKFVTLSPDNEDSLMHAVDTIGPLSTTMYVSESVKHYKSGILVPTDCNRPPNHAVVLMGYGKEKDIPYWIIKNSWGLDWGEEGYLKLVRGKNACNIGRYVATVVFEDDDQIMPFEILDVKPKERSEKEEEQEEEEGDEGDEEGEGEAEGDDLKKHHHVHRHNHTHSHSHMSFLRGRGGVNSDSECSSSKEEEGRTTTTEPPTTTTTVKTTLEMISAGYKECIDRT